jgi:hypothetical protein
MEFFDIEYIPVRKETDPAKENMTRYPTIDKWVFSKPNDIPVNKQPQMAARPKQINTFLIMNLISSQDEYLRRTGQHCPRRGLEQRNAFLRSTYFHHRIA